ncbi:MAG: hypothetical protein HKO88_13210 [Xanthomonadales bacterium]|nr:hypothetical protein [Xanthomonadales bacterium]
MADFEEVYMSVFIAIFLTAVASASLLVLLSRFLTSRIGTQNVRKRLHADRRKYAGHGAKPSEGALKAAVMRRTASVRRGMEKNSRSYQTGIIRKPWGW